MSAAVILALGVVAFCVASGVGLWLLKHLVNAVENLDVRIGGLEATAHGARKDLTARLEQLDISVRHHTNVVRDTAERAPQALQEQHDRLAVDNERLTGALARILEFTPDPETGTYQAGVKDALDHAREQMRQVLA